jgi:uncharacterized protein (DUF1697 family)
MHSWVALFRGINVGGNNIVPMHQLLKLLGETGCKNAQSYIQSGNVVFDHDSDNKVFLTEVIVALLEKHFKFKPKLMLLTTKELQLVAQNNPFPEAKAEGKSLHLFFMESLPIDIELDRFESIKAASESFEIIDKVFYLHAPAGIGRSKLAAKVEKMLDVATTARNWNTVNKLLTLNDNS